MTAAHDLVPPPTCAPCRSSERRRIARSSSIKLARCGIGQDSVGSAETGLGTELGSVLQQSPSVAAGVHHCARSAISRDAWQGEVVVRMIRSARLDGGP